MYRNKFLIQCQLTASPGTKTFQAAANTHPHSPPAWKSSAYSQSPSQSWQSKSFPWSADHSRHWPPAPNPTEYPAASHCTSCRTQFFSAPPEHTQADAGWSTAQCTACQWSKTLASHSSLLEWPLAAQHTCHILIQSVILNRVN